MGTIKRLNNPNRVLVSIGCDELIGEILCIKNGGQLRFGNVISHIAAEKLLHKAIERPKGMVKIRFDQPTGQYQILFMHPGDLGE